MSNDKWVLTPKEIHLGYCKDTFRSGAIVEYDSETDTLWVDGRKFADSRDFAILMRQRDAFPDNPWLVPYSKDTIQTEGSSNPVERVLPSSIKKHDKMRIISSDEDLSEEIDIRHTQVSKTVASQKEDASEKIKRDGLEVIRGDETIEERIANSKGDGAREMAKRVALKESAPAKMEIVRDDDLGAGFVGESAKSMNVGQKIVSREEADSKAELAKSIADSRKASLSKKPESKVEDKSESKTEAKSEKLPKKGGKASSGKSSKV